MYAAEYQKVMDIHFFPLHILRLFSLFKLMQGTLKSKKYEMKKKKNLMIDFRRYMQNN